MEIRNKTIIAAGKMVRMRSNLGGSKAQTIIARRRINRNQISGRGIRLRILGRCQLFGREWRFQAGPIMLNPIRFAP
jgi:hypothetical protein